MAKALSIVYEDGFDWNPNISGYFEPDNNTVHIVKGETLELRALYHELAHYSRQNKVTFQLGAIIANPLTNIFLLLFFAAFTVFSPTVAGASLLLVYVPLFLMHQYEEYQANKITKCEVKQYGELIK